MPSEYFDAEGVPVKTHLDIAADQAAMCYEMAMENRDDENAYRRWMGMANLFYMLAEGYYSIRQHSTYSNTGVY